MENFTELRRRGLAYAICYFPDIAYDTSGLDLFEKRVVPALQ